MDFLVVLLAAPAAFFLGYSTVMAIKYILNKQDKD